MIKKMLSVLFLVLLVPGVVTGQISNQHDQELIQANVLEYFGEPTIDDCCYVDSVAHPVDGPNGSVLVEVDVYIQGDPRGRPSYSIRIPPQLRVFRSLSATSIWVWFSYEENDIYENLDNVLAVVTIDVETKAIKMWDRGGPRAKNKKELR